MEVNEVTAGLDEVTAVEDEDKVTAGGDGWRPAGTSGAAAGSYGHGRRARTCRDGHGRRGGRQGRAQAARAAGSGRQGRPAGSGRWAAGGRDRDEHADAPPLLTPQLSIGEGNRITLMVPGAGIAE